MNNTPNSSEHIRVQPSQQRRYPAFLSLEGKVCVVVGGGRVAARKVRPLLAFGAHVRVISPLLHTELQELLLKSFLQHVASSYSAEQLAGASLVFAATNDRAANQQIAEDAHRQGVWCNIADNPEGSDFHVPATIQRGDLTLAISTGGGAPAFARYVRELLEQVLSEALGQTLELIAQARPLLLAQPREKQAELWESLLALGLETLIVTEGYAVARKTFETWLVQNGIG